MPRVGSKAKTKRDLNVGLWIVTGAGTFISVDKSPIKAEKIISEPAIRYGKPYQEGKPIELLEPANWPIFREELVDRIRNAFADAGFTAESVFPKLPNAEQRLTSFLTATLKAAAEYPLASYSKGKIDRELRRVENFETYEVVGVNEKTGKEQLRPFPYLEMTHQIREITEEGRIMVWPRIYYDLWLPESHYELSARDDADRIELWKLGDKLNHYPFPRKDLKGVPILEDGKPIFDYEEGMLVKEGYVSQSGSRQQYHALIVPKRITAQGEEKFLLEMKLTKTPIKYAKAMPIPRPGEVPTTVAKEQRPLVMESFAELLAQVVA